MLEELLEFILGFQLNVKLIFFLVLSVEKLRGGNGKCSVYQNLEGMDTGQCLEIKEKTQKE